MLKKFTNKKGFTLMEMLIVVAIIAILIAIAIPTFNSALNKSKVATDTANIRSGYASMMVEVLAGNAKANDVYTLNEDGTVSKTATTAYKTKGKNDTAVTIGKDSLTWAAEKGVTYTVDADGGNVTIKVGT